MLNLRRCCSSEEDLVAGLDERSALPVAVVDDLDGDDGGDKLAMYNRDPLVGVPVVGVVVLGIF